MPPLVLLLVGLVLLVGGAELLVRGASRLALLAGISPLMVGLTVVSFGTSAPEIAVTVGAAAQGSADLALGNVVGSNVFNILMVLGFSAVVAPLVVDSQLVRLDVPVMLGSGVVVALLAWDRELSRTEGAILVALGLAYVGSMVMLSRRTDRRAAADEEGPARSKKDGALAVAGVVGGLGVLVLGARWTVAGASELARGLGVSELVVGLTVIAVGTSLPELATSALAAARGQRDMAVGNAVGSSIFNLLPVLGLAAFVAPSGLAVPPGVLAFDVPVMLGAFAACLPIFLSRARIERWEGILFVLLYMGYLAYLVLESVEHPAREQYGEAMLLFVLPLVVIGLLAMLFGALRRRRRTPAR